MNIVQLSKPSSKATMIVLGVALLLLLMSSLTYAQINFTPKTDFNDGIRQTEVATADINSDGKKDLVVANELSHLMTVFTNTTSIGSGNPTFYTKTDFSTGSLTWSLALGDFDVDGKPDVVTSNWGNGTVSVFRNTTTPGSYPPTFASKVDYATSAYVGRVIVGDINLDNKPDIIAENMYFPPTASIWINSTPAGTFLPRVDITIGGGTLVVDIAVGDINGDGKPDLCVPAGTIYKVFINTTIPGTNNPTFNPYDFTCDNAAHIALSDINNDGKLDVTVSNGNINGVSVYLNSTTPGSPPSFYPKTDVATGTTPMCIIASDINNDGKQDLVLARNTAAVVSVLQNTTTPGANSATFLPKSDFATGLGPHSVAAEDLNGDYRPDLAVAHYHDSNPNICVLMNRTPMTATGGTITYSDGNTIHTFTSGGTFSCTGSGIVKVLVVAGGGGGGGHTGGGGGAGGVVYNATYAAIGNIPVTVGSGGIGSRGNGNGGVGQACPISGSYVYYAGGGGGGVYGNDIPGAGGNGGGGAGSNTNGGAGNGTANTGGGGGGGGLTLGYASLPGGNGGSGIVIVSYPSGGGFSATGGTITYSGGNTIHTFTSSGTFSCTGSGTVRVLVVGGGGGGGCHTGGGGGAGGFIYEQSYSASGNIAVTVGAGGAGSTYNRASGSNGSNSVFGSITATGGGGGASRFTVAGNGGSGGGGSPQYMGNSKGSGTSGQGYAGGFGGIAWNYLSGGGGGAGEAGISGTGSGNVNASGSDGSNSVFGSITAIGGGGGASRFTVAGSGGSGGGGSPHNSGYSFGDGTSGQGYAGGVGGTAWNYLSGGGGGAGSVGSGGTGSGGNGSGGTGLAFDISGPPVYYAGGGGGGVYSTDAPGAGGAGGGGAGSNTYGVVGNGAPNTGGGGGGGGLVTGTFKSLPGGDGGSGIVIVSYPTGGGLSKSSQNNNSELAEGPATVPTKFCLLQNYPNPFNPSTIINYELPEAGFVLLKVYDMLGREVAVLQDGIKEAGRHFAIFDASKLSSGMYISRLTVKPSESHPIVLSKKMLLMK